MDKNKLNKILDSSLMVDTGEDNWLYCLCSEYIDDNEGYSKREYLSEHFYTYFPYCESFSEDILKELEDLAFERM